MTERNIRKSKMVLQAIFILVVMTVFLGGCGSFDIEERTAGDETSISERAVEISENNENRKEKQEILPTTANKVTDAEPEASEVVVREQPTYISEAFLAALSDAMERGEADEMISDLQVGVRISEDEADAAVVEYLEREEYGYLCEKIYTRVDADNDGIEDLFVEMMDGGTMGNSTRFLFRGQQDGSFLYTYKNSEITSWIYFVAFDGKNYLLETLYNYNTKENYGYKISEYQNGEVAEIFNVTWKTASYKTATTFCTPGMDQIVQWCEEEGKDGFHTGERGSWECVTGSAEMEIRDEDRLAQCTKELRLDRVPFPLYCADINNDGELEYYGKETFYPSSRSTVAYMQTYLYFPSEPEKEYELTDYYHFKYEGTPVVFWVDKAVIREETENIICLLCYDGLEREVVYGYLVKGKSVKSVFIIEFQANREIEWRRREQFVLI